MPKNVDSKHRTDEKEEPSTPTGVLQSSSSFDEDDKDKGRVELKREIGLVRGVALIVGAMIGSGIFISPKGILLEANSVGMSLVVWFFCASGASLGAMCFAELGTVIPRSGGTYQYILLAYGDLPGFLVAWCLVLVRQPSGLALKAITFGTYVAEYVTPGDCGPPWAAIQIFSILPIMIVVISNCVSVRWTSDGAVFFSSAKVIVLLVIIVMGLINAFQGKTQYLDPSVSFAGSSTDVLGYGMALYYGFWAYGGWAFLNYLSEELKNPSRNIPLAIGIALPVVTIIYLLTNIAYFTVLSPVELLASSAVAVSFAEQTLGVMAWLIPLGVCLSTFGSLLGSGLSAPRVTFAAGREGHMLKILSMVHVKLLTPLPAILLQGAIGIVLILIGDFRSILAYEGFVGWIFNGAAFMSVLVMRHKHPDKPRPFKVNILVPILATLVAVFMVLAPLISKPALEYLYGLVVLGLGLLVYLLFVWGKRHLPFMNHVTLFCQKLLLVSPSSNKVDKSTF